MLPTADMAASRSASFRMPGARRGATAPAGAERRRDRKMLPSGWKAERHEHPRPYAAAGSHSYTCPCRKLELEHIDGVVRPRLTLKHAVDALDLSVRLTLDSGRTDAPQRIDTSCQRRTSRGVSHRPLCATPQPPRRRWRARRVDPRAR